MRFPAETRVSSQHPFRLYEKGGWISKTRTKGVPKNTENVPWKKAKTQRCIQAVVTK